MILLWWYHLFGKCADDGEGIYTYTQELMELNELYVCVKEQSVF